MVDPLPAQQDKLVGLFPGIGIFGETSAGAVDGADIVVLAVKPQQMRVAAQALASYVPDVSVVMSIAAGVRMADIGRWLGGFPRLVRAMPNTPALIGEGISGAFALPEAGARGRKLAQRVLEGVGEVLWVGNEELLDAITGVSGSGPAYVFYFLEGLEQAARELGFSKADARMLAYATFTGTVELARRLGAGAGHTARASDVQGRHHGTGNRCAGSGRVKEHFVAAVKAATARARKWATRWAPKASGTMAEQVTRYLLDVVFGLFTYALLLRFAMQLLRAPFRNPLGQAVIALTDWIVKPLRKVLPGCEGRGLGVAGRAVSCSSSCGSSRTTSFSAASACSVRACRSCCGDAGGAGQGRDLAADRDGVRAGDPVVGRSRRAAFRLSMR